MSGRIEQASDEAVERAVRALQAGADADAFEPIYRRFYPPLHTFFANRPALREEADDLAQEALLRAYENIDKFTFQGELAAWLGRIADNVWKNALRRRATTRTRGGGSAASSSRAIW